MRKRRIIGTLLCIGIMLTCMMGCETSENNIKADNEINAADEDVMIAEDTGADEQIGSDNRVAADEQIESGDRAETDNHLATDDAVEEENETAKEEVQPEGPSLTIFGDSISTFEGYIPEGFAVFYPHNGTVTDVSQTWWMRLLKDTEMELCSNDSSSGSTCTGDSLNNDNPGYGCNDYRISMVTGKHGIVPDIIIVYLGTNDLLVSAELGDNDGTRVVEDGEIWYFTDAYTIILDKLATNYPAAQIYCCTLAPIGDWGTDSPFVTFTNSLGLTYEDYSEQIRIIANNKGIPVIDLTDCGIEIDNLHVMTSDGVHLTPDGMECVERAILHSMEPAAEE